MIRIWLASLICAIATTAFANDEIEMVSCSTSVNGSTKFLRYDINGHRNGPNPWLYDHYTFREILFAGWGAVDCPSAITLAELAPEFSPSERSGMCLFWDKDEETYIGFSDGKKDAYGICKSTKSVCERVGDARDVASNFANSAAGTLGYALAGAAGAATGASTVASAAGVSAVTHSSGAAILTGGSGYVAGSLASFGAKALAGSAAIASAVTAPITLTIVGGTAAVVGGATYLCWESL
ncbi:MAG: hypothetical protein IIX61_04985 [Loktanella sp.]|nr:hypothetical protein [Loktanella sp.]